MGSHSGLQNTAASSLVVTPNNAADIPGAESCIALYIGTAGTLSYDDAAGNTITGQPVAAGIYPVQVRRVRTGGDAANILSLHHKAETQPA